jgi:hypothetical protein
VPVHGHIRPRFSQQTFLLEACRYDAVVSPTVIAASGVDWSEVHAVRLLGVALAALILLWAIRRMFGGKK